jgi:hypothetical protein
MHVLNEAVDVDMELSSVAVTLGLISSIPGRSI